MSQQLCVWGGTTSGFEGKWELTLMERQAFGALGIYLRSSQVGYFRIKSGKSMDYVGLDCFRKDCMHPAMPTIALTLDVGCSYKHI